MKLPSEGRLTIDEEEALVVAYADKAAVAGRDINAYATAILVRMVKRTDHGLRALPARQAYERR